MMSGDQSGESNAECARRGVEAKNILQRHAIRLLLRKWDWRKRSPSPRPPPGEGEARTVPGISRPLVWNCFMGTHVGGYHQRSALRHLRAGGFENPALALGQALDAMRGDLVEDRIDFLADKIGASGHFRRDILPSPQERAPRSAHFGRRLRAA